MTAPHRLRADAARNRANILRAARTLFAARGEVVGIDEIAREAGVAVGTLYRHFPTKADLVNAIVGDLAHRIFTALDEAVARIDAGGSAFAELTVLTERISDAAGVDRTIKAAMHNLGVQADPGLADKGRNGLARIVEAGHAEGSLHPDVTAADLMLMMSTMPGDELPEEARRRWVQLILRGLAADPARVDTGG
ncbi:helix-turn-helix domain-containing protein [Streptomyces sp. DSM 44938]|uniref:Helix-turn-helix domain-containing protein n=1 Tax=Streptomyces litchfieldiae TaxID=3075543 RepID=A0ABU2N149_9ACTN|nr:helix-turn-helix domain-containing protein [Streptomyces sp. DSM 44938]MDT0347322.1 helix-turn-helix domain-containing protein [Streptomyces sp. DSM 44938]